MPSTINASNSGFGGIVSTGDSSGELQLQAAGTTVATITSTGMAVTGALTTNGLATSPFTMKNRIINGDMVISQRNGTSSVTPTNGSYNLDRWVFYVSQSSRFTTQQNAGSVTPPAGFTNYLGITSSSAYSVISSDFFTVDQIIEGFNTADLAWGTANARTVTLSFWVRSSLTGTFAGGVYNSGASRSYVFTYTISAANTWEQKSITIPGDTTGTWLTNNGHGIGVRFSLGAGSTYQETANTWIAGNDFATSSSVNLVGTNGATWYITGVQLERGSTATAFEWLPYGMELMLCQRYFQTISNGASGSCQSSTACIFGFQFPVVMRTAPTGAVTGAIRVSDISTAAYTQSSGSIVGNLITADGGSWQLPNYTGMTTNRPIILAQFSGSGTIQLSAEL